MTADEDRPSTVRKANRSGCIPTGGFVRTEGALSERYMGIDRICCGLGVRAVGAGGGELLIAGLNVFVSN